MGDELSKLNVRDFALADFAREIDVLQHVVETGVSRFNADQGLVQRASNVLMSLVK